MRAVRAFIVAIVLGLAPASALAQTEERRPFAWDVARAVLVDPTTYAPALISYESMRQDWKTSQVLFAHGWLEQNRGSPSAGAPTMYRLGMARARAEFEESR